MADLARTPEPPYWAVIFSSILTDAHPGYAGAAARMMELAAEQPGFLGADSARDDVGITVSYWSSLDAIAAWRAHAEHRQTQARAGEWYRAYTLRVCRVERDAAAG